VRIRLLERLALEQYDAALEGAEMFDGFRVIRNVPKDSQALKDALTGV
jgi:hypothetical protein